MVIVSGGKIFVKKTDGPYKGNITITTNPDEPQTRLEIKRSKK